jgi:hypothetical protein
MSKQTKAAAPERWWCEMRRAWVFDGFVVESEQAIAARGEPIPSQVGAWVVAAFAVFGDRA